MSEQQQQTNGGDESSAHARRANLFSKWRQRDRVAGTTDPNNNIDISASAGSNSIKQAPSSPSKRGSAPSLSSVSSATARAELDIGGSIGSSRKSTDNSRHRSRSRPRDGKSSSSRNRSKSRGKSSKSDVNEGSESTSTAAPTPSRSVER